ncbi:MAG: hypothetical protein K2W85_09845 [Phycisphaerales bacterium]|nr:hypothetical protein [Phycisphaerales bacterium]
MIWTAPVGSKVTLSVAPPLTSDRGSRVSVGGLSYQQSQAEIAKLFGRFGFERNSSPFVVLEVDDPRWRDLLDAIADLSRKGIGCLKAAWVDEPEPSSSDPHAWFELSTGPADFHSPARAPAALCYGERFGQKVISEEFRRVVDENGLTGLSFLPLEDAYPDDPRVWCEVYAEKPIGRGLDHPLIDPTKLIAAHSAERSDPAHRCGEPMARFEYMRENVRMQNPFIAALFGTAISSFRVHGQQRFVREHLPATDFAYLGWTRRPAPNDKFPWRWIESISCNARTRKLLIEAGILKAHRFKTLCVVPASDATSEILDRTVSLPVPPPAYTQAEASAERARRAVKIASRKPYTTLRFSSTKDAAAYLERRLSDGSATWTPARESSYFAEIQSSELFARTPDAWKRLAPLLPEDVYGDYLCPHGKLDFGMMVPEWNQYSAFSPGESPSEEEPSDIDINFGGSGNGDWFSFRSDDPLMPADARVVFWDHERSAIADEWPNIAAFAAHIVAACDFLSEPSQ